MPNIPQKKHNQLINWIILHYAPLLGPINTQRLFKHFNYDLTALISADQKQLQKLRLAPETIQALTHPNLQHIDKLLSWNEVDRNHILVYDDPEYPDLLKQTPDAPCLLFIKGDDANLKKHQLAIVGSRNPTISGRELAHSFAATISQAGLTITSGLALGIDGAAHRGALSTQKQTIAILGCGIDTVYPRSHRRLATDILAQQGTLISEYCFKTPPRPHHFPQRNRLISGLSLGTLVVEASPKSGSLITAQLAADQGREVFAIPGSPRNPLSKGCHLLLRQGATLVESPADILTELNLNLTSNSVTTPMSDDPSNEPGLDADHLQLLECMGFTATPMDVLIKHSHFCAAKIASMLLLLELKGYISSEINGYRRVK